jgi:potassium-transporting ATPase KdpC subunit
MRLIREALALLVVLSITCGLLYPLAVTGIAQALFPERASGSLIHRGGVLVGSKLIGQPFHGTEYLWPRPSATPDHPYNGALSGGSNLGPLSADLASMVEKRIASLRAAPGADPAAPVPVDLVTASASGLDPHITPASAFYQVGRIAAARGVPAEMIREIVQSHVEARQLGILGEPRVNVLLVNLDLDERLGISKPSIGR